MAFTVDVDPSCSTAHISKFAISNVFHIHHLRNASLVSYMAN